MEQTLTFTNRVHVPLRQQALRQGVPWPRGAVRGGMLLQARDEAGQTLPLAGRELNHWPDGSVQWSLLDLALDFPPSGARAVRVMPAEDAGPEPRDPVIVRTAAQGITLSNGQTRLTVTANSPTTLIADWEAGQLDVQVVDDAGCTFTAARDLARRVWVEDANPLRATVRLDGRHTAADGSTLLDYWLRVTLTAGRRDAQLTYHYHNREDREPGVTLSAMALRLETHLPADAARCVVQNNRGRHFRTTPVRLTGDVEICSSNTMALADYPRLHAGITGGGAGRVFIRDEASLRDDPADKPWFLRDVVDFKFQSADRPEAYVWSCLGLVSAAASLVAAGGNMIGLHPKSLTVRGSAVTYDLWPSWAGPMEITQGEGRTLALHLAPLPGDASDQQIIEQYLSWELGGVYAHGSAQAPVAVALDPVHVRNCRVFQVDKLPAYDPQRHFALERKLESSFAPPGPTPANGHWHFGDVFYRWDIGANNEEMAGHIWFQEFLRTGRSECLERGLAQAQHILDVDLCAHSADPYQRGGMCAHGPRHNRCAAYPSHMWFTELLFAYAMTGDAEFRAAAGRTCDNLLFWINDPQGFATICADGREAGQPLINLTWTYAFLPEQRYLEGIWKIVRECFMARVEQFGALVYHKPHEGLPVLRQPNYGQWAAWEGLFYVWELTGDEALRRFLLAQLEARVVEAKLATAGSFRDTDVNVAAYGYYLTGDPQWIARAARPFRAMFRCVNWPFGYVKAMFYLHLALTHEVVSDDDVLLG